VGLTPIAPEAAFDAMARLMSAQPSVAESRQPVVASLNGDRLRSALELRGRARFLSELGQNEVSRETDDARALRARLSSMPDVSRRELIARLIAADVRAVMELEPNDPINPQRGFFDLGMDSLMTVALKARLEDQFGINLSSSVVLDYPSVAALTDFFNASLVGTGGLSRQVTMPPHVTHLKLDVQPALALGEMSDEEVSGALAAELTELGLGSLR
jgi:acyl carrier protein